MLDKIAETSRKSRLIDFTKQGQQTFLIKMH